MNALSTCYAQRFLGRLILLFVALLFLFATPVSAAINEQIPFYGTLQDTSGNNLSGTYDMVFRFYDAPTGGTLLDTSTHTAGNGNAVTVTNGEFSALLGSGTGNTLDGVDFNTADIYIGLTIDGDSEMTPRERLAAAPYAFNSDTLDGYDSTELFRLDSANTATASTVSTLLTIQQNGAGDILNILDSGVEVFTILDGGNTGIGSTTPFTNFSISGDMALTGALYDSVASAGTNGMVLLSTGAGTTWVATSSLGIGGGGGSLFTDGGATTYLTSLTDNLGIGTTTSTAKLSVFGTIDLSDTSSGISMGGIPTLYASTTNFSVAFGPYAGETWNGSEYGNVALGYGAGQMSSSTFENVYVGVQTGQFDNAWGSIFMGPWTGRNNTGYANTILGYYAGMDNSGVYNTILGYEAANSNSGDNNFIAGYQAGTNNTGFANVIIGDYAGSDNIGDRNLMLGRYAGASATGSDLVMLGVEAGRNTTGTYGVMVGYRTGRWSTSEGLTALGNYAAEYATGNYNVAIGEAAGYQISGNYNAAMSVNAGAFNSGDFGMFLGYEAGYTNTGDGSNFIGYRSGYKAEGDYNDFMGYETGRNLRSTSTVAIGAFALRGGSGSLSYFAENNVALGYRAGYASQTGSGNNILIGYQAADNLTTGNNNIIIGYDIDNVTGATDNSLNIGNLIFGTGLDGTGTTLASGNIGIGVTGPSQKLHVAGNLRVTGAYYDSSNSAGTNGMVLQSTGTGATWVATSSLGIGGGGGSLFTDGGATTYLTALSDNLAIGSTTAPAKLSVAGNINLDGDYGLYTNNIKVFGVDTGGNSNITIGEGAGTGFVGAISAVAIGYGAAELATSTGFWYDNVYIGTWAGREAQEYESVLVGPYAGQFSYGFNNVLLGYQAGQSNTGDQNAFIGYNAGNSNSGNLNNIFGYQAGFNLSGTYNNLFGYQAGYNATNTNNNLIGYEAGYSLNGLRNNFFGYRAGYTNTGDYNSGVGDFAGSSNTGSYNFISGYAAGINNTGSHNFIFGESAGEANWGDFNIMMGYAAGTANRGDYNNIIGYDAGDVNRGSYNNLLGYQAGLNNQGNYNDLIGYQAGRNLRATSTVAIGGGALQGTFPASVTDNVAVGYHAGYVVNSGANGNILIGYNAADSLTTGSNNIIIGYDIENVTNTASNRLVIGNLIYGTSIDGTGTATSSGNIGIGTSTPLQKLQVFGDIRVGTGGSNGCIEDYGGGNIGGSCTSDERLKTDINPIAADGVSYAERLAQLTPVTYYWNEDAADLYGKSVNAQQLGLIAQDVEEVFPELVQKNGEGYRQVDFRAFPFYIIEAIKELWQKVTGLEEKVEEIDELRERLEVLEAKLDVQMNSNNGNNTRVDPEPEPSPEEAAGETEQIEVVDNEALPSDESEVITEEEETIEEVLPEVEEEPQEEETVVEAAESELEV